MIILIISDKARNRSKLSFKSFDEAAGHARSVIVPQVADAIEELMGQDDPKAHRGEVEHLCEVLRELFEQDEKRVQGAVDEWLALAEGNGHGDTWIEWVA